MIADVVSAVVAQLVEHFHGKEKVTGSIPVIGSDCYFLEGCPSGQREQTVNLPAHAFDGSNPSPSTLSGKQIRPVE